MTVRATSLIKALAVIAAGGVLRLPLEQRYTQARRAERLMDEPLQLSMRSQLGQTAFVAVLGGFRALVATMIELQMVSAWQKKDWGAVEAHYALCTQLQPRDARFWEMRAWQMGSNAADWYRFNEDLPPAVRELRGQQYIQKSIAILHEAVRFVPDNWNLYYRLGDYTGNDLRNATPDFHASAEWWKKASECPGAPPYLGWRHVYTVARMPGREREAWDKLRAMFYSPRRIDRTFKCILLMALLEPVVRRQDPSAKLPDEVAAMLDPAGRPPALDPAAMKEWLRLARRLREDLAIEMSRIPGREREAWAALLRLYHDPDARNWRIETALAVLAPSVRNFDPQARLPDELSRKLDPAATWPDEEQETAARRLRSEVERLRAHPIPPSVAPVASNTRAG